MKSLIKKLFAFSGYKLTKILEDDPFNNPFFVQQQLLSEISQLVIFDVGAHQGETALRYRNLFPDATLYAFEPTQNSFNILCQNTEKYPNILPVHSALGNKTGKIKLHINTFSQTNSVLPTHENAEHTWGKHLFETKNTEEVPVSTIHDFTAHRNIPKIDLLKIDAQGSEKMILEGAGKNLLKIKLIYTEMGIMPSYKEQAEFEDTLNLLLSNNFVLYNFYNLSTTKTGQLRQMDAVFLNKNFIP